MTAPAHNFIGSAWVGDEPLADGVDPADGSVVGRPAAGSAALADEAARVARQTSSASPSATSPRPRAQTLFQIADRLDTAMDQMTDLCVENGKLRSEAMGAMSETRDCAGLARNIRGTLQEVMPGSSRSSSASPQA